MLSKQSALRQQFRKEMTQSISSAIEASIPIPPLHELIAEYAEFVGTFFFLIASPLTFLVHVEGIVWTALNQDGKPPKFERLSCIIRCGRKGGPVSEDVDGRSFLIADEEGRRIDCCTISSKGIIESNDCYLDTKTAFPTSGTYCKPTAICVDPTRKNHYFIAFPRHVFVRAGVNLSPLVSLPDSPIPFITDCVCSWDGRTLYLLDQLRARILTVDTATGDAKTISGSLTAFAPLRDSPRKLVFDSSTNNKRDSVLFITSRSGIRKYDIEKADITNLELKTHVHLSPHAIACTSRGILIFSCDANFCIYSVDPNDGEVQRIAGSGFSEVAGYTDGKALESRFQSIYHLWIDDAERCVYLAENLAYRDMLGPHEPAGIRVLTLSPHLFSL